MNEIELTEIALGTRSEGGSSLRYILGTIGLLSLAGLYVYWRGQKDAPAPHDYDDHQETVSLLNQEHQPDHMEFSTP